MGYMLRQRITTVGNLEAIPTWRFKMPRVGLYTAIEVEVDVNRHADRTDTAVVYPIEQMIDKIELVEGGSRALLSLPGSQLDALNYWSFGRPNARRYRQVAGGGNIMRFFVMGGRDLYDREYGYDFSRLNETYLEYTHSMSVDVAEKFDVDDHVVTLYGWRWMGDNQPNFRGLMRARQIAAWATTGADVLKTIPIPIGTAIRRIGVQAKSRAKTLGGTIKKYEVIVNTGEYSPVTVTSALAYTMQEVADYRLNNELAGIEFCVGTNATEIPRWFSYYESVMCTQFITTMGRDHGAGFITIPATVISATTGAGEAAFSSRGYGFQKCLRLGFDHERNGGDLLQTAQFGALDVQLTETADGNNAAVFLEDILPY